MAVSITPIIGLNQLFSPQPSGDRASSQIGSSKSDPEWNVTPNSDPSSTSQSADAFSAALLDVLGDGQAQTAQPSPAAQPSKVQSAPDISAKLDPGGVISSDGSGLKGSNAKQFQVPAAASAPLAQSIPLLVSALVSPASAISQRLTNQTNQSSVQQDKGATQSASDSEAAQVVAIYSSILPLSEPPVGSPSIAPEETSPQVSASGSLTASPKDSPSETAPVAAPLPAPHTAAAPNSSDQPLERDSLVFEAQVRPQQSTPPIQTLQTNHTGLPNPAVAPVQPQVPQAGSSNPAMAQVQSQVSQAGSPNPAVPPVQNQGSQAGSSNLAMAQVQSQVSQAGPSNVAVASVQSQGAPVSQSTSGGVPARPTEEPAVSPSNTPIAPSTTSGGGDNGGSFQQGTKQDQNSSGPAETKAEQPAVHVIAASADTPVSSQINPNSSTTQEVSSKAAAQPIAQQPADPQPAVKTDMNLKVQGQSGENVTVRLSERSGSIQVTVRSADPGTTATLRHELPNIQAGLERAGLQMQGITSHQSGSSGHGNGQSGGQEKKNQNSGSEPQEKQNKRNTSQQDQWLDLMEGKS